MLGQKLRLQDKDHTAPEAGFLPRLLEYCRRLCQWAQKVKPGKLACFEAKNGAVAAISQKCLLRLAWRGISGLHFFFNKNLCTLPLEKDIGPRSRKSGRFRLSRTFRFGSDWAARGASPKQSGGKFKSPNLDHLFTV